MVDFSLPGGGFANILSSPKLPPPPSPLPPPMIDKRQKQVEEEAVLLAEKRKKARARPDQKAPATLLGEVGSEDKLGA